MELPCKVLEHPFYQAWNDGEVTREQLANYGAAYQVFMDRVPDYWKRVISELEVNESEAAEVVEEEKEHAELWKEWRVDLPEVADTPEMNELFDELADMSASELAGAIHAYEVQQPDVAETKRKGLLEHYGFDADNLTFFDEHAEGEEEHLAVGRKIAEEYADSEAFERGFEKGAKLVYRSLDNFV